MSEHVEGRRSKRDLETAAYAALLTSLKAEVRSAQLRAHRVVNTELLTLYWTIGRAILERQAAEGWGAGVIDRLADDLRAEFPGMRGFSGRNLRYMATAARAWPSIAQQPVAQLPWGHITVLLDRLDDPAARDWYAAAAVDHGWSRNMLLNQIKGRLRDREGAALSNFAEKLPRPDSDLAQQLTRDPYVFDFLDLTASSSERELEQGLMDSLQRTLSEFGRGFSFIGRQVHFEVEGRDFFADLVFFHVEQLRFIRTNQSGYKRPNGSLRHVCCTAELFRLSSLDRAISRAGLAGRAAQSHGVARIAGRRPVEGSSYRTVWRLWFRPGLQLRAAPRRGRRRIGCRGCRLLPRR